VTTPTFQTDFAQGCVTALASLARRISGQRLASSASEFGIGGDWKLPLKTFSGSMADPNGDAAIAKIIAGQGAKVSPLAMALVAAAVKSGTWRPPVLVTSPATPDPTAGDGTGTTTAAKPVTLDPAICAKLRTLMRAGVASGAASLASAPGDPVYGVAAEVTQTEKKEHTKLSWFVGWQGDVAVAALVESPDPAAAPSIAGSFFRNAQPQT